MRYGYPMIRHIYTSGGSGGGSSQPAPAASPTAGLPSTGLDSSLISWLNAHNYPASAGGSNPADSTLEGLVSTVGSGLPAAESKIAVGSGDLLVFAFTNPQAASLVGGKVPNSYVNSNFVAVNNALNDLDAEGLQLALDAAVAAANPAPPPAPSPPTDLGAVIVSNLSILGWGADEEILNSGDPALSAISAIGPSPVAGWKVQAGPQGYIYLFEYDPNSGAPLAAKIESSLALVYGGGASFAYKNFVAINTSSADNTSFTTAVQDAIDGVTPSTNPPPPPSPPPPPPPPTRSGPATQTCPDGSVILASQNCPQALASAKAVPGSMSLTPFLILGGAVVVGAGAWYFLKGRKGA